MRDPGTFIVDIEEELNAAETTSGEQGALMQLMQMVGTQEVPQIEMQGGA